MMNNDDDDDDDDEDNRREVDEVEAEEEDASELMEALRREANLKSRVDELVTTLEKLTRNSEARHQQSADFVDDLKRANAALVAAFEKAKKKHLSKVKKMEATIQSMTERHECAVDGLKQRIALLEEVAREEEEEEEGEEEDEYVEDLL